MELPIYRGKRILDFRQILTVDVHTQLAAAAVGVSGVGHVGWRATSPQSVMVTL